jgi:hypothetical protein
MGGPGAWRKLAPKGDNSTDVEIKRRQQRWRRAHPRTTEFWYGINRAAILAMRHPDKVVELRALKFKYTPSDSFLRMKLPNGRKLAYPFPRLKTSDRGDTVVVFMDVIQKHWGENRHGHGAYGGTWTENAVQAIARDLFVDAMQRLEAAGYEIILHAHNEAVAELPEEFGSLDEFLAIFTEVPTWASGLPVAAKARVGTRWCKIVKPETTIEPEPQDEPTPENLTEDDDDDVEPDDTPTTVVAPPALPSIATPLHSLIELIGEPGGKVLCPFHSEKTPSLQLYADHFHCFGCGAHGDAIDWLMIVEGLDRDAALQLLEHGPTNSTSRPVCTPIETQADRDAKRRRALQLWDQAQSIEGTLAERYLTERRGIDLARLPDAAASLRFHPSCPFGPATRHPCLIALRQDVFTDEPVAIHRIALTPDGQKIERRMLGSGGVVKLYPAGERLGEGIETTLAAATRITRWGRPLQPAWSAVASNVLATLPPIPGVEHLIILVDNDVNGVG